MDKLLDAADNHGSDTGILEHTVGDLRGLLTRAWSIMSVSQRNQFLESFEVEDLISSGARDEFSAKDLLAEVEAELAVMERSITAAGYVITTLNTLPSNRNYFFWEQASQLSGDFPTRGDAIKDAFQHLQDSKALG